ncbi:TPA: tyrosine-type recombinase/integrase [Vibrio alginolyticus]|nr:site-specific integrase [Vibrio parahaemolyticus]
MSESQVQTESIEDDFRLLEIEVDTLAKLEITNQTNEDTGEVSLSASLAPSNLKSRRKKTKIILAPDGSIVYPQSLYLVSKLRGEAKVKDTGSIARALLAFTRFLDSSHYEQLDEHGDVIPPEYLTYKSLTKYEEEGAPWKFAEFLLANCRHRNSQGDEALSLGTARSYMNSVIGFYKWLQKYGYVKNNDEHVVTHYSKVKVGVNEGDNQHDMLAHTRSNKPREVDMSNIMKEFPRADSTPAHRKLKPLSAEHQEVFEEYVSRLPAPFPLMFRLAKATGTRIDELRHFPAHQIGKVDTAGLDVVPIHITVTKGSKPRTIEVPIDTYEELEIYKFSKQRIRNVAKRDELIKSTKDVDKTDYLFISNKGITYSTNTLEKHFNTLRQSILSKHPSLYYRVHDLRSTFATNWLRIEAEQREVGYDFLMDELAELMGHASTSTTEKYVKFMNEEASQRSAARRKNNRLNRGQ